MTGARRVGIFGGTFDPPHAGHVEPVKAARAELGLDTVIYLPTAQPPHKPGRRVASPEARYAMTELALLHEPELRVSPHELTPDRPAYTVETLEHFRAELPEAELFLLLGSDSFLQLQTWRRWSDLPRLATLAVLARPGWDVDQPGESPAAEVLALLATGQARLVHGPAVPVSSSGLRAQLARGEAPAPGAMSPLVLDYVGKYALYR